MTVRTRFGAFAIVGCILVGAGTALAQTETPSGAPETSAQTETPSTWTDPPARGAAGPKASDNSPESGKPTENAATPDKTAPTPAKPVERAAGPEKPAPVADRARATQRSAKLRREQIRVAARSPSSVQASIRRPRYGRVARLHDADTPRWRRHLTERRSHAYRSRPPRDTARFAMRDERDDAAYGDRSPYRSRRAGWGGLIEEAPQDHLAQARAAGYIVMRSRTYAYPDGTRVRELTPYEPYGF